MSASAALRGALVRRVSALTSRAVALELTAPRGALVCSAEPTATGLAWTQPLRSAIETPSWLPTMRALLEGARIATFERAGTHQLWLGLTREATRLWLCIDGKGAGSIALLRIEPSENEPRELLGLGRQGRPQGQPQGQPHGQPQASMLARTTCEPASSLAELQADGEHIVSRLHALALDERKRVLDKRLRAELSKRQRRLLAIAGDVARAADAGALRHDAGLLLANLHKLDLDKHAGTVCVLDYGLDPPRERMLSIEPALGARAQAQAWFTRARKLERGAQLARQRRAETNVEIAGMRALLDALQSTQASTAIEHIADEARRFGVVRSQSQPRAHDRAGAVVRSPYRELRGTGERAIWVGRSAADNDALTLRHSKPHDLWLHARDAGGAHVIVPLAKGESCPPELLCDAATLAAHFSNARGEPHVDVIYTPRRYVQKPKGSPAGAVRLLREKVFRLELQPVRLQRLLGQEWAPDVHRARR